MRPMVRGICLYIPHISQSHWRFEILLWGEIGRQHVKASLAAAISPCFDLTLPPKPCVNVKDDEIRDSDRPPHRGLHPLIFSNIVSVL